MPRIENIRKFNEQLTQLGDEPRIAAARGEQIEEPRSAEENLEAGAEPSARAAKTAETSGGEESAGTAGGEQSEGEASGGEEAADEGMDDDLRALLGDMEEDVGEGEEEAGGGAELAGEADLGEEGDEEDPFADIDLDFDDEEEAPGEAEEAEEAEAPGEAEEAGDAEEPDEAEAGPEPEEAEPEPDEAEAEPEPEAAEEPEEAEPEPEEAPGEAEEPAEAEEPGEEAAGDEEDPFADIDLDFDDEEEAPGEAEEAGEAEEPGEAESDFDLGSVLDDLDLDEPEEATTPTDAAEEESFDIPDVGEEVGEQDAGEPEAGEQEAGEPEAGEQEAGEQEAGDEEDEFDFDFDLGEEEDLEESPGDVETAAPAEEGEEAAEAEEPEEIEEAGEPEEAEEADEFDLDLDEGFSFTDEEEEEPADAEAIDEDLGEEEPEELSATEGEAAEGELEEDEFDMGDFGEFGEGLEESGEDFSLDESVDEEGEESEDFGELDEFSLGDFGAEFGVIDSGEEEAVDEESELNPAAAPPTARPESEGTDAGPGIHLTDQQFSHLKQTLDTLPLNLRTIVEELIAGGEFSEEEIKPLVDKLVEGDTPKSIARTASGLKGEHIRLPRNYEVRRGVVFEEEKATFAWQFRNRFLPIARTAILAGTLLAGAIYLGYAYLYQPLYARSLYMQGLEEIEEDRYTVGNEFFAQAREIWETREWFYRYADSFIDKRQFRLAREKFDQLLENYPSDREGLLRYADLESRILGNYEHAEELYDTVLSMDSLDYDGLIGAADNYLRWGKLDRSKFEEARYHYARAYEEYGATNEIMQRFMRYFVRTDNLGEVEPLVRMFEEDRPDVEIDPEIYAETAGYLLDNERISYVREMLQRARDVDSDLPDVHYQLARFYDYMDDRSQQAAALQNARTLFPEYEPLGSRRLGMHIDTYTLSAEYYHEGEEYLTAEQYYAEAIDRYESARASDLVDVEERFGRMYAGLADIYYYESGEYDAARENYESAEDNEYSTNDMRYRLGWIEYRDEDYDGAIDRFETVSNSPSARNIRYALANTHYYRGNYFASETYLRELLDILEQERRRIGLAFDPEDEPEHRHLVQYRVMANNNLGVVMARRFEQEGDRELRGDALYYLTNSTQDATDVTRDPRTAERSDTTDLAFLNQRYLLYPDQPYSLRIYRDLPIDLEDQDFFPAEL